MSQAHIAIYAAKLLPSIGRYAAVRYCQKRGCPVGLLTLALQLEAVKHFKE
jgi:hypothetical protein